MPGIDYDDRLHGTYHEARRLLPETAKVWGNVARKHFGDMTGRSVLDLGSGTGRFSVLLADVLGAEVIGVEPSDRMRAEAEEKSVHPRVRYLKGKAEDIPLADGSCDGAWLSMVIHHFDDLDASAQELRRVLKPGGKVLVRNSFSGRLDTCIDSRFFPTGAEIDNARLPSVEDVTSAFTAAGLEREAFDPVEQVLGRSLADHVERIRQRGVSTFELISEEEFQEGLRRMEEAARAENPPTPVAEAIDLLVFSKT